MLERTEPAARDGSSHGSARIFRYAYPEAFYAGLAVQARRGWDDLERLSGQRLITPSGALDFGTERDPRQLAQVLDAVGVDHELLTPERARQRWPGITASTEVLWHPAAGVIDAQASVHAMLALARTHGARVVTGWPVASVTSTARGYRICAADRRAVDAEKVIVTAGGWLPDLLRRLPLPSGFLARIPDLQVRQENAFHFPYRDQSAPADGRQPRTAWPTFIDKSPAIETYSLPGGRDAGFRGQKLAEFNGGKILRSAAGQDGQVDPRNRARIIDYVTRFLPGLEPEPYAETTCLFTSTSSSDFLIDGAAGITVVSPCSGHGAKFAPLIGDIAADLATGSMAAPDRFTVAAAATRVQSAGYA